MRVLRMTPERLLDEYNARLRAAITGYGTRYGRQKLIDYLEGWLSWLKDDTSLVSLAMDGGRKEGT